MGIGAEAIPLQSYVPSLAFPQPLILYASTVMRCISGRLYFLNTCSSKTLPIFHEEVESFPFYVDGPF